MNQDISRELESKITAHPLTAVAIAFAAGALAAFARGPRASGPLPSKRTLGSAVVGGLSALVMGMIRNVVLDHLHGAAKSWLGPEEVASRDRSVESFLEH